MAKRMGDHMVANGSGRILVVSSLSATTPTPYEGVYGGTKAFGYNLVESLREALMAGEDMVVGGDETAHDSLERNRITSEPEKAAGLCERRSVDPAV